MDSGTGMLEWVMCSFGTRSSLTRCYSCCRGSSLRTCLTSISLCLRWLQHNSLFPWFRCPPLTPSSDGNVSTDVCLLLADLVSGTMVACMTPLKTLQIEVRVLSDTRTWKEYRWWLVYASLGWPTHACLYTGLARTNNVWHRHFVQQQC